MAQAEFSAMVVAEISEKQVTQSSNIHPSAIIASTASLGSGVEIGAFSVIGEHVVIGDNVKIHHHVVIDGNTKIGDGCEIFPFASLGTAATAHSL